ncbi:MAG: hypothetical protein QW465_01075 [Candidatus Anstonellales archaeon]
MEKQIGNEIKIDESRIAQEIAQELKNINPNNVDRELLKKILGLLEDKNYSSSSNESQIEINDVKPFQDNKINIKELLYNEYLSRMKVGGSTLLNRITRFQVLFNSLNISHLLMEEGLHIDHEAYKTTYHLAKQTLENWQGSLEDFFKLMLGEEFGKMAHTVYQLSPRVSIPRYIATIAFLMNEMLKDANSPEDVLKNLDKMAKDLMEGKYKFVPEI